ncbi:hypothetical protein D3874_26615 [Oleomonas cavernae]|uniref:Uncharacterized protein n=2 Tax=Oleomonas cavernae TaxID=2320859 RepID=A0A418VU69_9PROT|nr:hypothetical protein D3874_26615 [Oleomonas cavernae]
MAVMATSQPASAGNLRDEQQVEIAPATEGRQPARPGLAIPPLVPKGQSADPGRLAAGTPAPDTLGVAAAIIDSLPVLPSRGIGLTIVPDENDESAALHSESGMSIAGMLKYRKSLP